MEQSSLFLADLTWTEAAALLARRPVGLLPIGAIEAHGPHLPLDTDIIIAIGTARRSAERLHELGVSAVILPPVSYTVSFVGTSFAGTSPVARDPFQNYLASLLCNLAPQGYRALICCNAHLEPAHVESIHMACHEATAETSIPIGSPDQRSSELSTFLSDEFRAGARHAGSYETSIVLAEHPEAVRGEVLSTLEPVWIDLPARLREGARTFADAGAAMGYFGDPARASEEEGHHMLDALAGMVVNLCRSWGVLRTDN